MKWIFYLLSFFVMMNNDLSAQLRSNEITPLPDSTGFAGSFGGVVNGALIVAGGSNFPNGGAPWLGSKKVWYDKIFALKVPSGNWEELGTLPRPLGYGVSVTTNDGLLIIGGSNENGHYADVFLLRLVQGALKIDTLQPLPVALANTCGARVGASIYIAGGLAKPDAKSTENAFFAMDISMGLAQAKWEQLPSWPGPSRMLGVAAAAGEQFYLLSGAELMDGRRNYLKDAYRFSREKGWEKIADLPFPAVAAPAPVIQHSDRLLLPGGDDGANAGKELRLAHPGFSRRIMCYDIKNDYWSEFGKLDNLPIPVTTPLVHWNRSWIIPGGEIMPGVRTPKVYAISFE